MSVSFFVPGIPQPKGSARAYVNKYTGRAAVVQDNREKQRPWASMISYTTMQHVRDRLMAPKVSIEFFMPRPKNHFGAHGLKARFHAAQHIVKPDLDKLVRCVLDALKSGGAYEDDSRVVRIVACKTYASTPGALINLEESEIERTGVGG